MARSKEVSASSKSLVLIALVLAIAAMYFGRQLFIPLALALVFTFLLTPFVSLLEKIRFRRVPVVITVLALAFALGGIVTWKVANQLVEVMVNLGDYNANLDTKIRALHASKDGNLSKAAATIQALSKELAAVPGEIAGRVQDKDSRTAHPIRPVPVQVAAPPSNFVQDLRALLGPLAEPAETAAIVIIFTLFMLIKREDLRNRAIRLAGRGQLNLMTQALDDAARRLSRYLVLQCLVNAGYGLLFGLTLSFIGVPHALLGESLRAFCVLFHTSVRPSPRPCRSPWHWLSFLAGDRPDLHSQSLSFWN
ncbi:MAG: AI-2E family transporter [Candidatus Sulfotelmatobacter sp.]